MLRDLNKLYSNIHDIPLIINACITGGVVNKKDCIFLPVTHREIVAECVRLFKNGASIIHLHVRDENGLPTLNPVRYKNIIEDVKGRVEGAILCISASGRFGATMEDRLALFDIGADMVSLTLGSMNFINASTVNTPEDINILIEKARETYTRLELEIFDIGMLNYALYLHRKNILLDNEYVNIILGSISSAQFDLVEIGNILNNIPPRWIVALGGLGKYQLPTNTLAIATGKHVRVGLEDNIYFNDRNISTNFDLVKRVKRIAHEYGRRTASISQTREILNKLY